MRKESLTTYWYIETELYPLCINWYSNLSNYIREFYPSAIGPFFSYREVIAFESYWNKPIKGNER